VLNYHNVTLIFDSPQM